MLHLDWDQLPGRKPPAHGRAQVTASLSGKRVLVTGAAGCIGGSLARAILQRDPEQLVLVDISEQGIYELEREFEQLEKANRVVIVLGNICDLAALSELFSRYQPHIVFHAAAFKHVPLLEKNPFSAIANNALGTASIVEAAQRHHCEQLIFVSTDKAADPASVMGASKRIGEVILLALRKSETKMKAVRLGNVLSSSGSIVPLFSEQISSGKPVTVTHPEVRRYFMTVEETVAALLEAASAHIHDGIWVPVLGEPVRITELAKYMFSVMRPEANAKMEMIVTDLRPGDKLEEVLVSRHESWAEASNENALLRPVNSPLHIVNLEAAIDTLRHAVHDRDLAQLMRGISQLVPEYEPWPNSSFHDSTATSGVIG